METSQCSRTSAYFVDVRLQGAVTAIQIIDGGTVVVNLILQVLVSSLTSSSFLLVSLITSISFCINILLQFLVCSITGLGFLQIDRTQCIEPIGYVFVNCVDRAYQIVVDLFDDLILRSIGTLAFCPFLCNSLITSSRFCIDILLQFLVCSITGLGFLQIDSTQCIEPIGYVFVNCVDRAYQIVVDLFDDLILRSISTFTFCSFLRNGFIPSISFCIDIILQCLICSCTSLLFSKVIFVQLICNRSNICINRIKAIGHILINIANDFILFCIGTNTVCDFLMQSSIYGCVKSFV